MMLFNIIYMRIKTQSHLTLIKEGAAHYDENKSKMNLNRFCFGWHAKKIFNWFEEHFDSFHDIVDVVINLLP